MGITVYGIIAWIATLISMLGYILNIKKRKSCFFYWEVGTILVVYNFIWGVPDKCVYYATATLFIFYGIMNIVGYIKWGKDEKRAQSNVLP